jgi:hypothetical protein
MPTQRRGVRAIHHILHIPLILHIIFSILRIPHIPHIPHILFFYNKSHQLMLIHQIPAELHIVGIELAGRQAQAVATALPGIGTGIDGDAELCIWLAQPPW